MSTLHCTVVTPEMAIFEADAEKVTLPAWDGEMGILPRHARLLAKLGAGVLRITTGGATEEMFVEGGFAQVADDRVTILTDRTCAIPDIDVPAAEKHVDELRGTGRGPDFADAKHLALTKKRVKDRFNRS